MSSQTNKKKRIKKRKNKKNKTKKHKQKQKRQFFLQTNSASKSNTNSISNSNSNSNLKLKKNNSKEIHVIGQGKDGLVIEIDHDVIVKILKQGIRINQPLINKLEKIDPDEKHFSQYIFPNSSWILNEILNNQNIIQFCQNHHFNIDNTNEMVIIKKKLIPLDKLNKTQYRHLRSSLELLHSHKISHGDLVDNVMIDPVTNNPIIIDWENAKLNADAIDIDIDQRSFRLNFKIKK